MGNVEVNIDQNDYESFTLFETDHIVMLMILR